MPRVLLVYQPTEGGVGRHIGDLAAGLIERGCEVVLCGPERPVGGQRSSLAAEHVELDLRRAVAPGADLRALRRYTAIVRSVKPDLIHAHSSKAGAIARLGRLGIPRIPVLYTPHGYAFAGFFSRGSERRVYREMERVLAPLASRVLCVCEAEARLARSVGPSSRVRIVHNGVEPLQEGLVDPEIAALAQRGPVVCAITQLRPGKGLETLIEALPEVLAEHPSSAIALAGEGPELAHLRVQAGDLGVEAAVHFLGRHETPAEVLRGARIFVHPSWAESFPYVVLEAMAAGLPIVASDVGGIAEALVDGESGVLVPAREQRALARALIDMLEDADGAASMGACARRRMELCFTLDAMVDGVLGVYRETGRVGAVTEGG